MCVSKNVFFFLIIFGLPFVKFSASAAEELDPMVVVESRTPEPLKDVSPWVTRLSGEELDQRQVYNLTEALRNVPGVAVIRSGQEGAQASLFSRGSQSDHVSFLYEGRKLNRGFSGTYNLGQLSLNGVSSVEVLRGSSSVQYGAQGIGGAVMLRSQPSEKRLQWNMEGGENQSLSNRISYGFDDSGWNGLVATSFKATDNEQPHSEFDHQSGSFHVTRKVSENLKIDLLGLGTQNEVHYPGNRKNALYPIAGQYQEIDGLLVSPGVNLKVADWEVRGFYSYSEDNLNAKDSFSDTTYKADTHSFDVQVNGEVVKGLEIALGGLFERDTFYKKENSTNLVDINEKEDAESVFALTKFSLGYGSYLTLGGRYDRFSNYPSASTYSVLLERDLSDAITLSSRYSTSFSAPQANDLYGSWGNPNLRPEEADSWEVGILADPNPFLNLRLTYFDTRYTDLIDWNGVTTSNVGAARAKGVETSWEVKQGNYSSLISFSYLDALNSNTQQRLLRRPRILGGLVLQHSSDAKALGLGLNFIHDVKDLDGATFATIDEDDYVVLRLFGDYRVTDTVQLTGRVENLLDKKYEEADGYPALGRAIYAGLRFSF